MIDLYNKNGDLVTLSEILEIDIIAELNRVNRIEVIDEKGRSYVNWDKKNNTKISIQDSGRTLKIFISK